MGEWHNNLFEGNGIYIFSNGERYEGELLEGKKEGLGSFFYNDGNVYEG